MSTRRATRPFTVDEYYRMADVGILGEDDRVELLDGEIVRMTPIGSRHSACVDRLVRKFTEIPEQRAIVRVQNPLRLSQRSEPQPDLCLVRPRPDYYGGAHPGPGDAFLVVEVAETSLESDRDLKIPLYARAGVPEVWLVDLERRRVHLFRQPSEDGYRSVAKTGPGDQLVPQAFPELTIPVDEILA
ncbi:MAG: Uma2 family endonuclease [Gemmatimonadales bacterium]